jgi:hypothetical protein
MEIKKNKMMSKGIETKQGLMGQYGANQRTESEVL